VTSTDAGSPTSTSAETPASDAPPPVAERRPTVIEAHGDPRVDDWVWIRDRDDPAVLELLRAENAHTAAAGAGLAELRERLFEEIRARIVETDLSVPVRRGPWWYYARTFEGRSYAVHCRLPVDGDGRDPSTPPGTEHAADTGGDTALAELPAWPDEQVLLDENALAEGHAYLALGSLAVSPGHSLLAYATDTTGDERFTLRFRDLASGEDRPEAIEGTSYGAAWAEDDATVFYTRPDDANRPYQVWRHLVGSDPADDVLVFEEPDERFHLGIGRTKDGTYVVIGLGSQITSEVHVIDARAPETPPRVVEPRRQGVEYSVEHHSGTFLILTNDDAENFRLMAAPAGDPGRGSWRELVAHRAEVRLDGVDAFARHLVLFERVEGEARVRVVPLAAHGAFDAVLPEGAAVPCPESPSTSWAGANPEFESATLRYEYSSLVTPRSVFDVDMDTLAATLRRRQPVIGYDPAPYETRRLWAGAEDGTRVPMSVVARRDTPLDGSAPCLLYGYGAYEISMDPVFSSIRLSLLERGVVFAIAHVRGGGELGRHWYEDGKLAHKPNTFGDFVACARHLVDEGWTNPGRLVARGGSAGGLLMGAAANAAPDTFGAIVAEVPFVDCLTTMLDDTLPLTVIEWEEWGNPAADPEIYRVMKSYSPYDNVAPRRYPRMFVTAGLEDPRVGYWEPAKWVQKLRAADPANDIRLKVELEAGHGGPSGRYDAWRDEAEVLAFVLDAVGLAD
jgi:oligopeptidase B